MTGETAFEIDSLLTRVVGELRAVLARLGGEVAHLKVIALEEGGAFGVANLVSSVSGAELSLASNATAREADLIVNARVAMDPGLLEAEVRRAVADVARNLGIAVQFRQSQSLRPGRPTPTHRYVTATG